MSTDFSFLSGRHNVETLADTISDVDVRYFHNLSHEDLIDPCKSTKLRATHMRANALFINARACNTVDGGSVKTVVEAAKVCIFGYARNM